MAKAKKRRSYGRRRAKRRGRIRKPGILGLLHLVPGLGLSTAEAIPHFQSGNFSGGIQTLTSGLSRKYTGWDPNTGTFNFGEAAGTYGAHIGIEVARRVIRRFAGKVSIFGQRIV